MYNKTVVDRLVAYIEKLNGIGDKNKLADAVQKEFSLVQDRKVYYCADFAIRFSKSESKRMSNTVLSLSALQNMTTSRSLFALLHPLLIIYYLQTALF